jgi:hypothetical protein
MDALSRDDMQSATTTTPMKAPSDSPNKNITMFTPPVDAAARCGISTNSPHCGNLMTGHWSQFEVVRRNRFKCGSPHELRWRKTRTDDS